MTHPSRSRWARLLIALAVTAVVAVLLPVWFDARTNEPTVMLGTLSGGPRELTTNITEAIESSRMHTPAVLVLSVRLVQGPRQTPQSTQEKPQKSTQVQTRDELMSAAQVLSTAPTPTILFFGSVSEDYAALVRQTLPKHGASRSTHGLDQPPALSAPDLWTLLSENGVDTLNEKVVLGGKPIDRQLDLSRAVLVDLNGGVLRPPAGGSSSAPRWIGLSALLGFLMGYTTHLVNRRKVAPQRVITRSDVPLARRPPSSSSTHSQSDRTAIQDERRKPPAPLIPSGGQWGHPLQALLREPQRARVHSVLEPTGFVAFGGGLWRARWGDASRPAPPRGTPVLIGFRQGDHSMLVARSVQTKTRHS